MTSKLGFSVMALLLLVNMLVFYIWIADVTGEFSDTFLWHFLNSPVS
ncbi:MAG: hypothetical protein VX185_01075 [Pseudomonadota bacterium]|nr:hypothetical protein [Pseudomonadota bacterium]